MKVAIVGGAPSSEMLAPFADTSWEIWVLGNRASRYLDKRVSRIFEIHENLTEHPDPAKYRAWLCSHGIPLVVGAKFAALHPAPQVEAYPYELVEASYGALYLTSSPAYMVAYALLNPQITEIAVYGVDLSVSDHEYFWQRPCMEYWIGFARGRGVKVTLPEQSHLCKSKYVEGRDWNGDTEVGVFSEENFMALAGQYATKHSEVMEERHKMALKAAMYDGAKQAYTHMAKVARAVEAQVDVKSLEEVTLPR